MLDGPRRALALADRGRDLGVAEPLDEAQEHDPTLVLAELVEGGAELGGVVAGDELGLGAVVRGRSFDLLPLALGQRVEPNHGSARAVVVDDEVMGETQEPGT